MGLTALHCALPLPPLSLQEGDAEWVKKYDSMKLAAHKYRAKAKVRYPTLPRPPPPSFPTLLQPHPTPPLPSA
jgi:hypothetical protein